MKAILLEDIHSNGKGRKIYGKKGEIVNIISDFWNVYIVELRGEKFPVKKNKLIQS